MTMPIRIAALTAALALAAAPAYEPAPTFQASKVLPARLLKGPHHTVAEAVGADEFYQQFHIVSDFGELDASGRTMLETRVLEVDALARLSDVSKGEVFAKSAGTAVLNIGKGVVSVVRDPEGTAKGIGTGLKRFGTNLGRRAKRAADSVTTDDRKPDDPDQTTKDKALDTAGGAANSVLGVSGAARRWAQKLGVDPYTTNPILHKALVDIGKIDAAGSIVTKVALPIPALAATTATVGGLVWGTDPEELRKTNEARLAELGVPKAGAGRFFANGNYTLSSQTRLIAALYAVKADGGADYVDVASDANDEREALFFVESAEMLAQFHETTPVTAVLKDSRAMVARTGARAVALLPFDYVYWTERLATTSREIAGRARQELGARRLEMRISGASTAAAKAGLRAAGWSVTDGANAPAGRNPLTAPCARVSARCGPRVARAARRPPAPRGRGARSPRSPSRG
jgi:hypothetical protein